VAAGVALPGLAPAQGVARGAGTERDVEVPSLPELDGERAVEVNVDGPGIPEREKIHGFADPSEDVAVPTYRFDEPPAPEPIPTHGTEVDFEPTRVPTRGIDTRYHYEEIRVHRIGEADDGRIRYHGPAER
jgi:hypothetical protein